MGYLAGVGILVGLLLAGLLDSCPALEADTAFQQLEVGGWRLQRKINYVNVHDIVQIATNKPIGFARWDGLQRKFTLFTTKGRYFGFLKATIETLPHADFYKQYLYYGGNNRYRGVFVRALGGWPKTDEAPESELGGDLKLYAQGLIPPKLPGTGFHMAPAIVEEALEQK